MCGILGLVRLDGKPVDRSQFVSAARLLAHRGPDDEGYLFVETATGEYAIAGNTDTPQSIYESRFSYSPKGTVAQVLERPYNLALANRRLAVIDLSPAGHQPLCNEDGTLWIIHNGEVYNFEELRRDLERLGHRFVSHTDSEVILHSYEEWGADCVRRFNGMWAFSIWNSRRRELFCSRDRLGVKPFHYVSRAGLFAFASEIKPLLALGASPEPNASLIQDFLLWGLLDHTEESFFSEVRKLPAASNLVVGETGRLTTERYWNLSVSDSYPSERSDEEYAEEFGELFTDAVRLRLRSDVPIGSCLSGGLDSSSIVCTVNRLLEPAQAGQASPRQRTFSACYADPRFDERPFIDAVIERTGAEKTLIFPSPEGFASELDRILWHQEEPFGGTSIYAQWKVLAAARKTGTIVLLDGQGSDEQLAGYRKFYLFYLMYLARKRRCVHLLDEAMHLLLSPAILGTLNLRKGWRYFRVWDRVLGASDLLRARPSEALPARPAELGYAGSLGERMRADLLSFSLPVLLRYEDRNAGAHAVEPRLPFLDVRLVEKVASLPLSQKLQHGWTKFVLRNALKGTLPEAVRRRKSKLGFATPEEAWFRGSAMRDLVAAEFERAQFLPEYVEMDRLRAQFQRYLKGPGMRQSDFFFRFFILERWARLFIVEGRGVASRPGAGDPC